MLLEYRFDTGLTGTVLGAWFGHRLFQLLHFCFLRKRQIDFTAYLVHSERPNSLLSFTTFFISSTDVVATCMYAQPVDMPQNSSVHVYTERMEKSQIDIVFILLAM